MPQINVSVVLDRLEQISPTIDGLHVHGANLNIAKTFSYLLQLEWIGMLEIFLPPAEYQRTESLALVAEKILPSWRIGKGSLRFFPIHAIGDVWKDGLERVLLCVDPELISRDRYLRDTFAVGPTIVSSQTHAMGQNTFYNSLRRVSSAPAVPFDIIVCLSEICKKSFELSLRTNLPTADGEPFCRLEVIGNPIDAERFRPYDDQEKRRARQMLDLPVGMTISLCLARLTPNSKADLMPLMEAFAEVAGPNDLLLCVGPENIEGYAKRLLDYAKELKLGKRFAIRTSVEHWITPVLYGLSDLYVLPSDNIQETFCTTIMEAMACGLPVLASEWDGIKESAIHEETGLLIPTYLFPGLEGLEAISPASSYMTSLLMLAQNTIVDPERTREYMSRLLRSPELRKRMGEAGRKRAEDHFLPGTIYGRHRELWEELLELARSEDPESRTNRKQSAQQVGCPVPYRALFAHYGTGLLEAEKVMVRLSKKGRNIAQGKEQMRFYDETLPLLRPELVNELLKRLQEDQDAFKNMNELATDASAAVRLSRDQALFHLGLMAKRGVLEYTLLPD